MVPPRPVTCLFADLGGVSSWSLRRRLSLRGGVGVVGRSGGVDLAVEEDSSDPPAVKAEPVRRRTMTVHRTAAALSNCDDSVTETPRPVTLKFGGGGSC